MALRLRLWRERGARATMPARTIHANEKPESPVCGPVVRLWHKHLTAESPDGLPPGRTRRTPLRLVEDDTAAVRAL